jgi:hypothetical protein
MSWLLIALGVGVLPLGCIPSEKVGFDESSPTKRLGAIVQASGKDADRQSLIRLVEQLDSQDGAARMLAIRALEHRTGTTLGYNHTDPEWERQLAIERWVIYLIKSPDMGGINADLSATAGGQP